MVENHALVLEFPQFRDKIHTMKTSDGHFKSLFEKYDKLDHEVRRIEDGVEATSDAYLEDLKKKRLAVKDELFSLLNKAAA
jgi:uncharacterized protein YdcH (DUF465 family)